MTFQVSQGNRISYALSLDTLEFSKGLETAYQASVAVFNSLTAITDTFAGNTKAASVAMSNVAAAVANIGISTILEGARAQETWTEEARKTYLEYEKISKAIQLQGAFNDKKSVARVEELTSEITKKHVAVENKDVKTVIMELLQQGVDKDAVLKGDIVDAVITQAIGMGAETKDYKSVTQGLAGAINARGEQVTADRVTRLGTMFAGAFNKSPLLAPAITRFGEMVPNLKQMNIEDEEGMALLSHMVQFANRQGSGAVRSSSGARGLTAAANILTGIATIQANKEKRDIIESYFGPEAWKGLTEGSLGDRFALFTDMMGQIKDPGERASFSKRMVGEAYTEEIATLTPQLFGRSMTNLTAGVEAVKQNFQTANTGRLAAATANSNEKVTQAMTGPEAVSEQDYKEILKRNYNERVASRGNWFLGGLYDLTANAAIGLTAYNPIGPMGPGPGWNNISAAERKLGIVKQWYPEAAGRYYDIVEGRNLPEVNVPDPQIKNLPGPEGYKPTRKVTYTGENPFASTYEMDRKKEELENKRRELEIELMTLKTNRDKRELEYTSDGSFSKQEKRKLAEEFNDPMTRVEIAIRDLTMAITKLNVEADGKRTTKVQFTGPNAKP